MTRQSASEHVHSAKSAPAGPIATAGGAGTVRAVSTSSVLRHLDAPAVSHAARIESRSREHHLPVTSLYRWWARRTSAVATGLLHAATTELGREHLTVADPFAGGGVIALVALLEGHDVLAQEIDPWAAGNLALMATPCSPEMLAHAEAVLDQAMTEHDPYVTVFADGTPARMAHTLRVAVAKCPNKACDVELRLFPGALVSRHERVDGAADRRLPAWFACPAGHLHEARGVVHPCPVCRRQVRPNARYTTGRKVKCWSCRQTHPVMDLLKASRWEPVLVQRATVRRFEIGPPTAAEVVKSSPPLSGERLGSIPQGSETQVLLQAGFDDFAQLYPERQIRTLRRLLRAADTAELDPLVRDTVRTCIIGSAEFAGHATRWDPRYLKPYETVAAHRYNVTTLSAEIDPWGERGRGTVRRRLRAAAAGSTWLAAHGVPEVVRRRSSGDRSSPVRRGLTVITGSSVRVPVPTGSVDVVLTDPPYHDDVQYGELASLFRAWAGLPVGRLPGDAAAVRHAGAPELERFEQVLTAVFAECHRIVKPDGHLVLSFANRNADAWVALFAALRAAGWHGAGFDVVHSENETDHAKSGRRSCSLDVLLDLTPCPVDSSYRPARQPGSPEERYAFVVGRHALAVGTVSHGWEDALRRDLAGMEFVAPRSASA